VGFFADFNIASPSSTTMFCNWPTELKEVTNTRAKINILFFIGGWPQELDRVATMKKARQKHTRV
jgi:hypothetical protein